MNCVLIDDRNIDSYQNLLLKFEKEVFIEAFPNVDERESFEGDIIPRIRHKNLAVDTPYSFCVLLEEEEDVIGGMVADWYPRSSCLEIIYIVIKSTSRERSYGKELLNEGIRKISGLLNSKGSSVRNVFLEVDIPGLTKNSNILDDISRLAIWHKLGARRVPINYVQPALGEGKQPVSNLMLMVLDSMEGNTHPGLVDTEELKEFLVDFYKGLKSGNPQLQELNDRNLALMHSDIDMVSSEGFVALASVLEEPDVLMPHATVTYHCYYESNKDEYSGTCDSFNSYECDLMNFMNQGIRPFKTKFIKKYDRVAISMPKFYSYVSEGIVRYVNTLNTVLVADISLSISSLKDSCKKIAHVSISPSKGSAFNNLDFIKLVTRFGSRQENYTPISETLFNNLSLEDFLKDKLGDNEYRVIHEGVGNVELDTMQYVGKGEDEGYEFGTDVDNFFATYSQGGVPEATPVNKIVCGLILGIFDYNRMNADEVSDTVIPVLNGEESLMILSRGHLIRMQRNVSVEDRKSLSRIFVTPYMLAPSVALAFNGILLTECEELLLKASSQRFVLFSNEGHIAQEKLNKEYLEDIFQYKSERAIVARGREQRSMNKRYSQLCENIQMFQIRKENSSDALVEGMLGVLGVFEIMELFINLEWRLGFISILVLVLIFEIIRYRSRKN